MVYREDGCYTIPKRTTRIKNNAFYGCPNLTSITIPEGVTAIGNDAFNGTEMETITIPKNVAHIGAAVFSNCRKLTSIIVDPENKNFCSDGGVLFNKDKSALLRYPPGKEGETYSIPDGVETIAVEAFDTCKNLVSILVDPDNKLLYSDNGILFSQDKSVLLRYPSGKEGETYSIPAGVETIAAGAFDTCTKLASIHVDPENRMFCSDNGVLFNKDKSLLVKYPPNRDDKTYVIPESVTVIGDHAFSDCWELASVTIPEGVTVIGDHAFSSCGELTSVTIPEGVTRIGDYAFSWCMRLASVTIPKGVTVIGDYAFADCFELASVTIPEGVTRIGDYAFSWCMRLASVTIPKSVTNIGERAFSGCDDLASITVDPENKNFCSDGGVLFNKDKTALLQYPAGKKDKTYNIPAGVTIIAGGAFDSCENLREIKPG